MDGMPLARVMFNKDLVMSNRVASKVFWVEIFEVPHQGKCFSSTSTEKGFLKGNDSLVVTTKLECSKVSARVTGNGWFTDWQLSVLCTISKTAT